MITVMRKRIASAKGNEDGFTTAELLGNAALGILALAGIWAAFSTLGDEVIASIKDQLKIGQ